QIKAALAGFNERALGPFLTPSLNGKQLVSVKVEGTVAANLQSANSGSVNADITVTNLLVRDPAHPGTNAPLSAHFAVEGSMQNNVINLKQARVALSPTQRAKNELELTGQVDMSRSNAIVANLTAHSDALDVTEFYDLTSKSKAATSAQQPTASAQPAPTAATATTNPNAEPDPVHLPVAQAGVDLNIAHLYVHDLDVALKGKLNITEGSHVVIDPFQVLVNNAPINAKVDLNLGVRGYTYNLTLSMDRVPVGSLADTFMPESKGAYRGDLIASANFKGQGTTGKSLHDNLVGQANMVLTNADVKLSLSKKVKGILNVVALVLQTPEINQSPLTLMNISIGAGSGQLQITNAFVQGAAYQATVQGSIPIADVLTNSPLNLPVDMALAKNLAQRSHLGSANSGNSAYVPLPRFLTIEGTIGQPKEKINKLSLAATSIGAIGGFIPGKTGQDASKLGSAIGGLFGGQTQQQPQGTTTNAPPATNGNKSSDLLKGLGGFLKKK
ncbi:MAG: AsmA family protein, partial [Limisphaerales bacterium]